jgi:NADPH2:quinone reductase
VIACASSDEKLEFAKAHGAELTLNYAKEDLKEGLQAADRRQGRRHRFRSSRRQLRRGGAARHRVGGRFLVIGFAAGDIPKMPLNLALLKGCDIRGVFWGHGRGSIRRRTAPTWRSSSSGPRKARSPRMSTARSRWRKPPKR